MFKNYFIPVILTIFLAATGFAQTRNNQSVSDTVSAGSALQINDDAITSARIIEILSPNIGDWPDKMPLQQFVRQKKPLVAKQVMSEVYNLLLYQHAKLNLDKLEISQAAVDKVLDQNRKELLNDYGGSEARAQTELKKTGTSIEDELEKTKKQIIIAGFQDLNFIPTLTITRSQMLQYYRDNLSDKFTKTPIIQFQLIDIKKEAFDDPNIAAEAASKALSQIKDGVDFAQVVKEFSHGFRKNHDGLWRPYDPDTVQPQYKSVIEALKKIEIGQSTGIVETDQRFFIGKLIDRKETKIITFPDAQFEIIRIIRLQREEKYRQKLVAELLEKASVGNLENFIADTTLAAYEQLKK